MDQAMVPINGLEQQYRGLPIVAQGIRSYLQVNSYQRYYIVEQPERVVMLEVLWSVIGYQFEIHRNQNVYSDFHRFNTNHTWNNVRIDERIHTYFDDLMMYGNRNGRLPITYDIQTAHVGRVQPFTNCNVVYCSHSLRQLVELHETIFMDQFSLYSIYLLAQISVYQLENTRQLSEYNQNEHGIIRMYNGLMIDGFDEFRSLNLMANLVSRFTAFSTVMHHMHHMHHQENNHQLTVEYHGNESSIPRYCDLQQIEYDGCLQGKLIMKTEIILVKEDNSFERVHSYYDKLCEHAIEKINDKNCSEIVEESLCDEKTCIVDDGKSE